MSWSAWRFKKIKNGRVSESGWYPGPTGGFRRLDPTPQNGIQKPPVNDKYNPKQQAAQLQQDISAKKAYVSSLPAIQNTQLQQEAILLSKLHILQAKNLRLKEYLQMLKGIANEWINSLVFMIENLN